ncbi:ribonuclease P protein subunit rpr2-like [Chrysoperla carnea]|uniref:ribonuclease P protein subunit rpr2-like n=1 Tax=Chrysoperla carnea TaxID=189513 RepID=UPI001D096950|nr:ribonuclease P protein subunit rpr2-like [Chrysoperla carnea]
MNKKLINIAGKESFQRMNYLYQASELMHKLNANISTHYNDILLSIAKKSVLRIDTTIKNTLCKGCHSLLEPGNTTRLRFKKKNKFMRIKCLNCGTIKRILCNKNYKIWNDRPESILTIIDLKNNT